MCARVEKMLDCDRPRRTAGRCRRRGRPASAWSASAGTSRCCMSPCCAAQGMPARARCGFGAYFEKGKYVDHWVTEYWNESAAALGAGRRPARCPPARAVRDRLRSARRAARPVPGGGRCLAALPRRQGRPDGLRHPRHARLWFDRRQRHPRHGRAQQPRDAAVGRAGAPMARTDAEIDLRLSSTGWPRCRTSPTAISASCARSTRTSASPCPPRCSTPSATVPKPL